MKLPGPREKLAGCVWLARIIAKARQLQRGELPPEYATRFCHPVGVDGHFLTHFGLTRDDIVAAAMLDDDGVARWFTSREGNTTARTEAWNHIAVNLGRPGFPMADRLPVALATSYKHLDPHGISTVFEALEADEKDS